MTKPLWRSPDVWWDAHSIPGQGGLLIAIGSQPGFWLHALPALGTCGDPQVTCRPQEMKGARNPDFSSLTPPSCDHVSLPDTHTSPCWDGVISSKDPNREQKKTPFSLGSPQNINLGEIGANICDHQRPVPWSPFSSLSTRAGKN